MPVSCSVHGCTNRHKRGGSKHFFKFPLKHPNKLQLWIDAVNRKGFIPNYSSRVCSDHFLHSDFMPRPGEGYNLMLKAESVPSLLMSGRLKPPKKMCNIETIHETPLQSTSMIKQKGLLNSDDGEVISSKFEGLSQEIFMNQLKNCKRHAKGHRYRAEIKKFALTLHYYSPKAYQ